MVGSLLKVLRRSPRPVVVVPPPGAGTGPAVILCDGSAPAARTLYAFQAVGLDAGEGVCLISLDADGKGTGADRAVDFLQRHGLTVRRETVPLAAPEFTAEAILHVARYVGTGLPGSRAKHRTAPERARSWRLVNPGHIEPLLTTHSGNPR